MEEAARFILSDEDLTSELKNLRHRLSPKDLDTKLGYLDARDSTADIGPDVMLKADEPARSVTQAVVANARRAEESLRVLEEISKTAGTSLNTAELQGARFTVYTIEKNLVARLLRKDKISSICGLHVVVDAAITSGRPLAEIVRELLLGGVRAIHLTGSLVPKRKLLSAAIEIAELCREHDALLIVDGALDIALATNADGAHFGQGDLPVKVARNLLPIDRLIGCSVRSVSEARQACDDGADYLSCEVTLTKAGASDRAAADWTLVSQIKKEVNLPLVAMGEITKYNVAEVMRSGADGIVTASALIANASPNKAIRDFIKAMEVPHEPAKL